MKTLQTIKDDYAKEHGCDDWNDLLFKLCKQERYHTLDTHVDSVIKIYAMECLKKASESVTTVHHTNQSKENIIKAVELTKQSINNENNLI